MRLQDMTREQLIALVTSIRDIVEEEWECDTSQEATERDLNKYDRIEGKITELE